MSEVHDRKAALRKWGWDVSASAMGGLLTALLLTLIGAMVLLFKPVQAWLVSDVQLMKWLLIAVLLITFFVGLVIGRRRSRISPAAAIPAGPARVSFVVPPFKPSEFEIEMIRVLRLADGAWTTTTRLMALAKADSRQDVEQAMARLTAAGWAADNLGTPMRYKLAGRGIDYARTAGFPTITGAERELGSANETPVAPRSDAPAGFTPGAMQSAVIRAMCYADGWISLNGLAEQLPILSRGEIRSVVRLLGLTMWVEAHSDNSLKTDGAQLFRLGDPALAYAREQGFQTGLPK